MRSLLEAGWILGCFYFRENCGLKAPIADRTCSLLGGARVDQCLRCG